jgi:hypothetical protein
LRRLEIGWVTAEHLIRRPDRRRTRLQVVARPIDGPQPAPDQRAGGLIRRRIQQPGTRVLRRGRGDVMLGDPDLPQDEPQI